MVVSHSSFLPAEVAAGAERQAIPFCFVGMPAGLLAVPGAALHAAARAATFELSRAVCQQQASNAEMIASFETGHASSHASPFLCVETETSTQ